MVRPRHRRMTPPNGGYGQNGPKPRLSINQKECLRLEPAQSPLRLVHGAVDALALTGVLETLHDSSVHRRKAIDIVARRLAFAIPAGKQVHFVEQLKKLIAGVQARRSAVQGQNPNPLPKLSVGVLITGVIRIRKRDMTIEVSRTRRRVRNQGENAKQIKTHANRQAQGKTRKRDKGELQTEAPLLFCHSIQPDLIHAWLQGR